MNSYHESNDSGQKETSFNPLFGDNGCVPQAMLHRNIAINAFSLTQTRMNFFSLKM